MLSDSPTQVHLTATAEVSRHLLQRLMRAQDKARAHPRPAIYTFNAWMNHLWTQIPLQGDYARPLLLGSVQELALWQDIIAESDWSDVLMQTGPLARMARQAHRMMIEWRITEAELKGFSTDETLAFRDWSREFSKRCRQQNRVQEYRLPDELMALPQGLLCWPNEVLVHGLQQPTAQQQALFAFLETHGTTVRTVEPERRNGSCARVAFAEQQSEFDYAANWARACLQQDAAASVAIALVDLPKQAPGVCAALDRVLSAANPFPSAAETRPYHLAQGASLAVQPIIDTALRILSQSRHRVDLGEFSLLLRSRYVGGGVAEYLERSRLDAHLRSLGELRPSLVYIAAQISDRETQQLRFACPDLLNRIHRWREKINTLPKTHLASAWATSFGELLSVLGWPGEEERTRTDIDTVNRWDELLSQLCGLDALLPPMAFDEALRWLRSMARDMQAAAPTTNARLHVISIDDAARIGFDHLWVCGLNDEQWPPAVRPNPLLPSAVQQQHRIPRCSNDVVNEASRQAIDGLMHCSGAVVFSYSEMEGEREYRVSPLIAQVEEAAVDALPPPAADIDSILFQARRLETAAEHTQALPAGKSGGTAIVKDQAACPFRAYVNHRLQAGIPEEPEPGLDASERGILLHHVLEAVWLALQSHAGLTAASEAERERIVSAAVDAALEKMVWKKQETLTPKFRELERERLVSLVMAWLHWEQQRAPFTVLKPEAKREIDLSGLKLNMRIDRIDENSSGERIIIDYKTGDTTPTSWFGERPDEPQLPLYALSEIDSGHAVAALSFAEVRIGQFAFKGIARDADQLPGVKAQEKHAQGKQFDGWQALLQHWQVTLNQLAADFMQGVALVDPKSAASCRHCELEGVCRVHELNQRLGRAAADEGDDV